MKNRTFLHRFRTSRHSSKRCTHCKQGGSCGAGLVRNHFLPREDVLEVLPHVFVEDHMEEEDEDSLRSQKGNIWSLDSVISVKSSAGIAPSAPLPADSCRRRTGSGRSSRCC